MLFYKKYTYGQLRTNDKDGDELCLKLKQKSVINQQHL